MVDDDLRQYQLTYGLEFDEAAVEFDNPPPIRFDTDLFTAELADGTLTCRTRRGFASVEEARQVVDPWLRADVFPSRQ